MATASIDYDTLLPPVAGKRQPLTAAAYQGYDAVLQLAAAGSGNSGKAAPHEALFAAVAQRRQTTAKKEKEAPPLVATLPSGSRVCRLTLAARDSAFVQQQRVRQAVCALLATAPRTLAVDIRRGAVAQEAAYTALVAAATLPAAARGKAAKPPRLTIAGGGSLRRAKIFAQANTLTRALVQQPPNVLTPATFAALAQRLAARHGCTATVFTAAQLKKLGAGAITAVGQAAQHAPRLLRIRYRPPRPSARLVSLVGKGVCYDTGGVNVKPARYMRGMGKDMAGAAVALSALLAAAQLRYPHRLEAWLALAENSIAANAYRPDDVITAANGKRIEIVHSDAEGRMLLADTLALASRRKPDTLITYATLTGTMHIALGEGMSGFFSTDDGECRRALAAAKTSGERLCHFPMPPDYKKQLHSEVADIKQCAESGDADHILAALFLREFISGSPAWLHLDLSSAACKGGLAAAPGDITGVGAAWTLAYLSA